MAEAGPKTARVGSRESEEVPGDLAGRKKNAAEGRCTIWFLDESGASLTPLVGKTWAPRGETPHLRHNFGKWEKVSLVSVVGPAKRMYFHIKIKESFKADDIARFLRTFLRHVQGNVVLFWDGASQHKGPHIRAVVARHPRLTIERLPPYGFEYNPDEGVWAQLKKHELANFTPHNTDEQLRGLHRAMRRIQRRPKLIAAFHRRSKLPTRDVELLLNKPVYP